MTSGEWLKQATRRLQRVGIATAHLDCLIMLEDVTRLDRSHLLAHPETVLSLQQTTVLKEQLGRRQNHEPLSYIRGKSEFYGRSFTISKAVLEPRPESETMIALLKTLHLPSKPWLADVGSGSGCLGITAKLELPYIGVDLLEIDNQALAVSKKNAQALQANVGLYQSDLLMQAPRHYSIILANLPYVPNHYQLNKSALLEPRQAIFGGVDGLDVYRKLFQQLHKLEPRPHFVLTEALPFQHQELATIALTSGFRLSMVDDFIQLFEPSVSQPAGAASRTIETVI